MISLFAGAHPPEPPSFGASAPAALGTGVPETTGALTSGPLAQGAAPFGGGPVAEDRHGSDPPTLGGAQLGPLAAPPLHLLAASRLDRDGKSAEYASLGSSGGSGLAFNNCFPVAGFKSILWPPILDGPPVVVGLYPHACPGFAGMVPL